MRKEELDTELVAWDSWCEQNPHGEFDLFAQERGLDDQLCLELRRILKLGVDVGRMTFEDNSKQLVAQTKERLTIELGNRFTFLHPLGIGGMGTVWLAEQIEPIRRNVAVKLIRNDLVSPATRKRFAFEQQALASLSHPNIATVHEAGETHSGRSFFIMEYIPGEEITDFCNRQKLDLLARLNLFLQVCDGVQYAHRKGLIHRDLKPGNVIVMEEDGVAVAKIIDFGLAKDTAKLLANESLTQPNAVIGSPAWMSPEQAQVFDVGDEVEVDTRTDVYSLGVILYQLLTNSTPIPRKFFRESPPAKIFEAIRNQLPAYPSRRLGERLNDSKSWIEDSSESSYATWVNSLKDDLDWIVMKAIEKNVSRRYESIGEFSGDIKRFIRGDSVTARPPSRLYHFKKMVSRNRVFAASMGAIAAVLILATGVSAWYAIKANNSQKLAERRQKSSEQLTKVFASGFDALSYLNPSVENSILKARLLNEIGKRMEATVAALPADLPPKELAEREYLWRAKFVEALESAEMDNEAITQLTKIIEYLSPVTTADDERLVKSRITMSECLYRNGDSQTAKKVAKDNLEIVLDSYPSNHLLSVRSEIVWLRASIDDRTFDENQSKFKELIERSRSVEKGHYYQIEVMRLAASYAFNSQEKDHGIEWLDAAQKLSKEKVKDNDMLTTDLEFEYSIQVAMNRSGREIELSVLESRLEYLTNALGESHPAVLRHQTTMARILNELSQVGTVSTDRPISLIRKTLSTCSVELGPAHPLTSTARSFLLDFLIDARRYQELFEALDTHLPQIKKYSGENSIEYRRATDSYLNCLLMTSQFELLVEKADESNFPVIKAVALVQLGRFSEAIPILTEYIESKDPETKEGCAAMVQPLMQLYKIEMRRNRLSAAIKNLRKAKKVADKVYLPTHPTCLEIRKDLATTYGNLGQSVFAIEEGKDLLKVLVSNENTIPQLERATLYGGCLNVLVSTSAQMKDFQSAKKYALKYYEAPISHKAVAPLDYMFKNYLGMIELELGNIEQGEKLLHESIDAADSAQNPRYNVDQFRRASYQSLSMLYQNQGQHKKALEYRQKAMSSVPRPSKSDAAE